jgi:hypothetical protein
MIIKEEKIIFIHIPKNAGQSVEAFFGRKWTPSYKRRSENPGLWPESFPRHAPWSRYKRKYNTTKYRAFAIVRNPWARMVSSYIYELKMAQKGIVRGRPNRELLAAGGSFEDYVRNANRKAVFLRPQVIWLRDVDGRIGVSDIIRFESLSDDFKQLARTYNLKNDSLPHVNSSSHKHYSEYYNEETIRLVAEIYKEDIETFGYTFDGLAAKAGISTSLAPAPVVQSAGPDRLMAVAPPSPKKAPKPRIETRQPPVTPREFTCRLPNFLIIGGMKCGTSSIGHNLHEHPQIHMARGGYEVHFFDKARNYKQGMDWYRSHFPEQDGIIAYGDKTPTYADLPNLPRIRAALPDAKLIMILRDPVSRFQSHYNYIQRPKVKEEVRLLHAREFKIEHLEEPSFDKRILDRGFYDEQLEKIFALYPRSQVHVAFLDDFKKDERQAYGQILDFIGVHRVPLEIKRFNEQDAYQYPFSDQAKKDLFRIYEPHNKRLFALLGRDQSSWMTYGSA